MSWLYTIVFAGLLISSNGEKAADHGLALQPANNATAAARQDETERFEQSYPLNSNGRVNVSNINGSIVVEAWDRNEVHLEAIKTGDTKEALADLQFKISSRPDLFSIEVDQDSWKRDNDRTLRNNRKVEVQFRLQVPRGAVLDEIETVNGSVTVGNFVNSTKVSAVNGNVTATNLRGAANLSTVNGEVQADFDRLETGSRISLSTVNGRASLLIPSDSNATVKAESLNGAITNDFGLPVRKGQYVGRDLYGRIGNGDVQIKLESVNGPLSIGRKNDGKSLSPAVNLLQQKKADDDTDWDNDDDESMAKSMKIEKQIAKAVKEVPKQTKAAMKAVDVTVGDLSKIKIIDPEELKEAINAQAMVGVNNGLEIQSKVLGRMRDAYWTGPMIEKKRNSFVIKGTPNVTVDAKGCMVRVRGWDKSEVQYTVTEFAGRRDSQQVTVDETAKESDVTLKVANPNPNLNRDGRWDDSDRVRIDVFVPRKTNLKIFTDREIRVDGVSGEIDLHGGDGEINVRDTDGKMNISAADGQVRVIGFKGDFASETADGDVFLEGQFQSLNAKAGDGDIYLAVCSDTNAILASNTEVNSEGVELKQRGQNQWSVGRGGPKYNFSFADGQLTVRDTNLLAANE